MAQEDADKTAFHTGKGIFSYIMMPFGLNNAGVTYQRLIDTAFEKQIERNLVAYVDDLVIKSTTHERIIQDMRETFDTLRRINMKLNPLKSPKMVKEVQSLTGKLATLTRFLSIAAERQFSFFKTLKGCLKQKSFVWTSEAEIAFQEMKKLLKTLPTLTAPIDGEILYLYISVANEAFGSVLIAERDKIQKHVYFVSKALAGRHPVHVLTNMPVKQVLTKPEISGRLTLWAVELGAYQISYFPRSAVKGQVLVDYLAEISGELEVINDRTALKPVVDETWDLFTDGASCAEGAGVGLVLASPSGEEHTYALRFNFDVTNNEAEYEALLAGLNIARKMNITKLRAFTDSQLVANQFNGSFEAHDSSMQKYLQLLKELAVRFKHFELAQVPRSQNKKADALSKLAALTFLHFQKQVWVEELPSKSIDNDLMVASVEEEQPNWMEPILQYIRNDTLPSDNHEARLVRERAPMYIIQNDILYRKSYCGPMMRCVGPIEAEMIVDELHNGSCALHLGYKTIAEKIMQMGYFWPSMYRNVSKIVKHWPFPAGPSNVKFLIMAIDYFTKWVEAKAVDELPNVLWAHRTTFKKSIGETPFSLVYGSEVVIPAEILVPTHIVANFEEEAYDDALGEWVLRNNDASRAEKLGILGPNWEDPYQLMAINAVGSYKIADVEGRTLPNAWHAALIKQYYA
ncbi:uncharacterized protein [Rutidosis leptorrhynchoides]|uniref:uncharacterized protein n=1 Tax=Rutidosis leptorrhynchoides TaxID=125765 RepID=UPI003A994F21